MSVMETVQKPKYEIAREQYLRIHKKLVGPKTAERLFLLHGDLSINRNPEYQHLAGWAAAEAALVATDKSTDYRLEMLAIANESWENTLSGLVDHANRRSSTPNRSAEFRVRTDMVFIPAMKSLVLHKFDHSVRCNTYDALLELAIMNVSEMRDAQQRQQVGRYSNHFGLAHEQTTLLAGNRLLSGRAFLMPSLARSGSGENYPSQTHDVQVANLRRGRFTHITPLEVKAGMSMTYDLPVISARKHFKTDSLHSIATLYEAFLKEREGVATKDDINLAQDATDKVFHLVTHYYRASELGKYCLHIENCMGRSIEYSQAISNIA